MAETGLLLSRGCFQARIASGAGDLAAAQDLRTLCFRTAAPDSDRFDSTCRHLLVEDIRSGALVCCFRILVLDHGCELGRSYSAQFYDLTSLQEFEGRMAEIGRFCIDPGRGDPDILRVAWAAITALTSADDVKMLFGCTSFAGTDGADFQEAFALLAQQHLSPLPWRPQVKAPEVIRFASGQQVAPDRKKALLQMPPLLRSYLKMGGWVSDHAVVDRRMGTLHVFTGLEISAIPASRRRLLMALAAGN